MAAEKNATGEKSKRATRKKYEDMTPEEREAFDKRNAPKRAYIAYSTDEGGNLEIVLATRSAEEVLAAVDANRGLKYKSFEIR